MVKRSSVRLDSVFHALSDATRRDILHGLARGEKTVGEVAKPHKMSLAAVSKHIKVLEEAELIARERRGAFHIVRLKPLGLRHAEEWMAHYTHFWNTQLDQLENYLGGKKR